MHTIINQSVNHNVLKGVTRLKKKKKKQLRILTSVLKNSSPIFHFPNNSFHCTTNSDECKAIISLGTCWINWGYLSMSKRVYPEQWSDSIKVGNSQRAWEIQKFENQTESQVSWESGNVNNLVSCESKKWNWTLVFSLGWVEAACNWSRFIVLLPLPAETGLSDTTGVSWFHVSCIQADKRCRTDDPPPSFITTRSRPKF